MNLLWIYLKSVTDMALYMTEEEALAIVKTFTEPGDVVQNCAVDLAVFDIIEFGLEDWLSWHPYHIVGMFIDMAESTLDDIVDEIDARAAGEELIDEMLGSEQTERIDYPRAVRGMKEGSINLFYSLLEYINIHNHIKQFSDDKL